MAKQVSSKRGQASAVNKDLRSDKRYLQDEPFQDNWSHKAMLTQHRATQGRVNGSRPLATQIRSLRPTQRQHHADRKYRYDSHLAQALAHEARYPTPAQPEAAYIDVHSGESAPSPPPEPTDEVYTYLGYSREKGQNFEFEDDRPLSRKRVAWLRFAEVGGPPSPRNGL